MQDGDLHFTFTQLPAGTIAALLQTYLSMFGEVERLDLNESQRSANVMFSSAPHPDRILNEQHKFMGQSIAVTRHLFSDTSRFKWALKSGPSATLNERISEMKAELTKKDEEISVIKQQDKDVVKILKAKLAEK